ncbi:MAG: glycoside hydrolase family 127 protein [Anaerolineae bacterium]
MAIDVRLTPVPLDAVDITDCFWAPRQQAVRSVTLPIQYEQCRATGRIDAWRLHWRPGEPSPPHVFWDSDVAKWIEAAAYSLTTHPDPELEGLVDGVVDLIAAAQQPDSYLNTHFIVVEPEKRWTNLRDWHELYCAGHLMEAAVAYYRATGKRVLLDVLCRYADLIDATFGREEGKRRGYPGHEEIELALVKLYRATGEGRYLRLAQYFVEERGSRPHYYDAEARARGEDPAHWFGGSYAYNQSHLPVRQQETAEGHAVRAMYLYAAMADLAGETGDESLLVACRRLWRNVTQWRLYVTGGVGSSRQGERFTYDYGLPNEAAYAETCAAIGLVFWAHRMLQVDRRGEYADVMERALYNGVLSGISLSGDRFFYVNPLEVDSSAAAYEMATHGNRHLSTERQPWFDCACCPPNVARLLTSLGQYVCSTSGDEVYVHLYVGGTLAPETDRGRVLLRCETRYPWDGAVRLVVQPERETDLMLALRVPGWCRRATLAVNGEPVDVGTVLEDGYARIRRLWRPGDVIDLTMAMPVERVEAHPAVRSAAGRVALQRGPLVYCLEQVDNGPNLNDISLARGAPLQPEWRADLLEGVVELRGEGRRRSLAGWEDALYRAEASAGEPAAVMAVPYYAWANREPGDMLVWVRSE